jgi:hypothetical protein
MLLPIMCIQPLVGFRKNRRIHHLLTLRYRTMRWIRKMRLQSVMLNPARVSLAFVLMLVHIVGCWYGPSGDSFDPEPSKYVS